jgi:hypothetical protein
LRPRDIVHELFTDRGSHLCRTAKAAQAPRYCQKVWIGFPEAWLGTRQRAAPGALRHVRFRISVKSDRIHSAILTTVLAARGESR